MPKVALITGATSGIGLATTEIFIENGYTVWAVGRRTDRLHKLVKKFGSNRCKVATLDVTDAKAVNRFFKKFNPSTIDLLINNAGLALGTQKAQEADFADWQAMIETNITGLMRITSKVLPALAQKPGSHIVNVGSVAGKWVYPGGAVYCATKAAVKSFSEGLRIDLLGKGVRVTNIEPGMVETEFSVIRMKSKNKANQVYAGMTPLTAVDIAKNILWCVQQPAHVNISELTIFPTDQAGVGPHLVHRKL